MASTTCMYTCCTHSVISMGASHACIKWTHVMHQPFLCQQFRVGHRRRPCHPYSEIFLVIYFHLNFARVLTDSCSTYIARRGLVIALSRQKWRGISLETEKHFEKRKLFRSNIAPFLARKCYNQTLRTIYVVQESVSTRATLRWK